MKKNGEEVGLREEEGSREKKIANINQCNLILILESFTSNFFVQHDVLL